MYDPKQQDYTKTEYDALRIELAELDKPITEHPDVQRLIIQVETLSQETKKLQAKNERLKESLLEIKANSYPGLAVKESTMLNTIFRLSTQALKGEPNGRYRIRPKDFS